MVLSELETNSVCTCLSARWLVLSVALEELMLVRVGEAAAATVSVYVGLLRAFGQTRTRGQPGSEHDLSGTVSALA